MGCARGGTAEAGDVEETPYSAHAGAVHPVNRVERRDIRRRLGESDISGSSETVMAIVPTAPATMPRATTLIR